MVSTGLFTLGIFAFAWLVPGQPLWLSLLPLSLPLWMMYRTVHQQGHAGLIWHIPQSTILPLLLATGAGLVLGTGVGSGYRLSLGMSGIPMGLTLFAITAVCIGAAEEFIFRGALFYLLRPQPAWLTIPLTAAAHAGYKTLLFASPYAEQALISPNLFWYTFLAGLILGGLRLAGGSLWPPLLAHVAWDLIVYGDSPAAPWWVW
ncbi:MAG: CPBP family intramembrane metalloprotease [Chitinophagaceae bacterium]|nr:CPBP family intramembrane metalloprotease [Chitinophagaceae bacterium]